MAIQNGFFKSINGDRRYLAEFFTSYFASFIGNGVFPNPSTNLQVINNQNFSTIVRPGKGWINGHYLNNDDNIVINHQPPDGVLRRIDRIVFSVNLDSRSMDIYLKQGTPSSAAVAPALIRNSTLYELALADIAFNPGATSISQSNITDQRMNKALCGIVHGVVEQLDTTTLFNQYQQFLIDKGVEFDQQLAVNQQTFDDWFAQLNDILDGDVAANLANMIITHTNNATPQKHIEVVNSIPQDLANKGLLLLVDDVDNPNNPPEVPTSMVLFEQINNVSQQLAQNTERVQEINKRTSGKLNVKEFNVVGSGQEDDTNNLRNAFQYAIDNDLTLELNSNDQYRVTEILNFTNIDKLKVLGNNATFIFSQIEQSGSGLLRFEGNALSSEIELSDIIIRNNIGELSGIDEGLLFNLEIHNFKYGSINNVKSFNAHRVGVQIGNVKSGYISNSYIYNTRYAGIRLQGTENFDLNNNYVENVFLNVAGQSVGYGITLSISGTYSTGTYGDNKNINIFNNKIYNVGRKNIDVHNGTNVIIRGNHCYNKLDANNKSVYGLIFALNEGATNIVKNIIIDSNILENESFEVTENSSGAGIRVGSASANYNFGKVIISNNIMKNIHKYNIVQIYNVGTVEDAIFSSNTIDSESNRFSVRGLYVAGSKKINRFSVTNNTFNMYTGEVFLIRYVENLITVGNVLRNQGLVVNASIYHLENIDNFKRNDLVNMSGTTVSDIFVNVNEIV